MAITGNRGEWSEIYVFFRLLADGKLYAANEKMEKLEDMYFPILNIMREERDGKYAEYKPNNEIVKIYLNDEYIIEYSSEVFAQQADLLLSKIISATGRAFSVEDIEKFMSKIEVESLKAPSKNKSDILMEIYDIQTGYRSRSGFSIKSEIGGSPTLLNPGETTNFIYKITNFSYSQIDDINSIDSNRKIMERIAKIKSLGGSINFYKVCNDIFESNLKMIDSKMPELVAELLLSYYSGNPSSCELLTEGLMNSDPLKMRRDFYSYKIKELLSSIALGLTPGTHWNGYDDATGGYIVVRSNGNVLAYHIYNRDKFKDYLLINTKLDSPGTKRYKYGKVYQDIDGNFYIKLCLQIRFK